MTRHFNLPDGAFKRLPLFILLAIFIVLKIPHLFYPFYWDESWPYASAINQLYVHGPSLLPGAIPGELSRGHPLMFHFLAACWMKVFGTSHVAMHAFALAVSVALIISAYEICLKLFNERAAILAIVLIAFQQMFFVQSAMLLFEIFLALTALLSIYFYSVKRYALTALFLTLLFYTKESGIVVGVILGIDAFLFLFNREAPLKEKLQRIAAIAVPTLLILLFFVLQKLINGWYVLPLYKNGLEKDMGAFYDKFRAGVKVIFRDDRRRYFFVFLSLLTCISFFKGYKKAGLLALFTALFVFLLCSDDYHSKLPMLLSMVLFAGSFVLFVISIFSEATPQAKKFTLLLSLFVIAFIAFSAVNMFFINRYLLIALIPVLVLSAAAAGVSINRLHKYSFYAAVLIILAAQTIAFRKDIGHGDIELGAFDGMYVQQKVVDFLVEKRSQGKAIGTESYLLRTHLQDPYSGFLHSAADTFTNVKWDIDGNTSIAVFDNIEPDKRYEAIARNKDFVRVARITKNDVWAEIYMRRE